MSNAQDWLDLMSWYDDDTICDLRSNAIYRAAEVLGLDPQKIEMEDWDMVMEKWQDWMKGKK